MNTEYCVAYGGFIDSVNLCSLNETGGSSKQEDQDVGGWIILGWILERWDGVMWTGLIWLRIGTGGELW
jgi:hypothetical protein